MKLRRYAAALVLSSTLAFVLTTGADAASISSSTVTASVGDVSYSSSQTTVSGDNIRFAQVLSSSYNRPIYAQDILRLKADFNFGFGDISLAYATAEYSGRPVDEIGHLRLKNMGWGEIAKMYGVKVKDLKKRNHDVVNVARGQGVDVAYIEVDDNDRYDNHRDNDRDNDRDDHKKDNKHDNGKGKDHKK